MRTWKPVGGFVLQCIAHELCPNGCSYHTACLTPAKGYAVPVKANPYRCCQVGGKTSEPGILPVLCGSRLTGRRFVEFIVGCRSVSCSAGSHNIAQHVNDDEVGLLGKYLHLSFLHLPLSELSLKIVNEVAVSIKHVKHCDWRYFLSTIGKSTESLGLFIGRQLHHSKCD